MDSWFSDRGHRRAHSRFSANQGNQGHFIPTGLGSRSRHPDYFGEIMLWVGVAIIVWPSLRGRQGVALLSPVFATRLLIRVSGFPLLEAKADKKWGGQLNDESYQMGTPGSLPRP
jgi:steroid 5-alpha reductase family enzyme